MSKKTQGQRGPDRAPRKFNPAQLANLQPRKAKTGAAKAFYVRADPSVIEWLDSKTAEERGHIFASAREAYETNNCSPKLSDSATVTTEQ